MALNLGPLNVLLRLDGANKFQKDAVASTSKIDGMTSSIKALAAGYISVAGAQKAFDLAGQAAAFEDARRIFDLAGGDLDKLRNSVNGMISDFELVKRANLARTMGIPSEAMGTLAQAAIAASTATGESVNFMLDSIVRGVARGSPLILDNLGIIISIEDANKSYAATLGKTTKELTKSEQAQAVLNATLKAVKPQIDAANKANANTAEIYAQTSAAVENLSVQLGQSLMPALAAVLPVAIEVAKYLGYIFTGTTPELQAEKAMSKLAEETANTAAQLSKARKQLADLNRAIEAGVGDEFARQWDPALDALQAQFKLSMQIFKLQEKMRRANAKATTPAMPKVVKPSIAVVSAPAEKPMTTGEQMAAVQGLFAGYDVGTLPIVIDATAEELERWGNLVGFASEEIDVFGDGVKKTAKAISRFGEEAAQAITQGVSTAARVIQSKGQGFGPEIGAAIGSAIGSFAGSPQIGGALGQAIGEVLGPTLDVVARVVGLLAPVFEIINKLMVGLLVPVVVALAPTFERLANNLEFLLPFVDAFGWGLGLAEFGLSQLSVAIENIMIAFENLFIFDENAKKPYKEFTSIAEYMAEVEAVRAEVTAQLNDETADTVESFRELNEELSNVPIGIKRLQLQATRGDVFPSRWSNVGAW